MTEKLKQIAKEEIAKLPTEMQEVINMHNWVSITEDIAKRAWLSTSETNNFQVETLLMLTGIESGESYARNVENNVGVSKNEAEKITDEAFEKIFNPIIQKLEAKMKEKMNNQKPSPEQTLDFIMSGGDYLVFMDK